MTRMEFGTAGLYDNTCSTNDPKRIGLRATMGPGYSQMNDLTIIQTSQVWYSMYMIHLSFRL